MQRASEPLEKPIIFSDHRIFVGIPDSEENAIDLLELNTKGVDLFAGEAPQFDDITMLYLKYHSDSTSMTAGDCQNA